LLGPCYRLIPVSWSIATHAPAAPLPTRTRRPSLIHFRSSDHKMDDRTFHARTTGPVKRPGQGIGSRLNHRSDTMCGSVTRRARIMRSPSPDIADSPAAPAFQINSVTIRLRGITGLQGLERVWPRLIRDLKSIGDHVALTRRHGGVLPGGVLPGVG